MPSWLLVVLSKQMETESIDEVRKRYLENLSYIKDKLQKKT